MKRKVRFIAALFCMGCLVTEPAADIKAAGIQVAAAQTTLSADNSLEVLSLSAGTLSPDFTGKTVQYTATVPNDVTSVTVTDRKSTRLNSSHNNQSRMPSSA